MSFHHKSALAHICTFVLIGGGWFSYMPWAIGRGIPFPEVAIVGAGLLFLGNGLLYVYLRTLRCPNCLIRFGPKMYRSGLMNLPWPRKDFWNCGAHLSKAQEEAHTSPPSEKRAPPPQRFPMRWRATLTLVVVWNALGLASLLLTDGLDSDPKPTMAIALIFLLAVSWGTKHLRSFQHFIVSDGHSVEEIKRFLTFCQAFAVLGLSALLLSETAWALFG
jgi:hypothetical protein